MTEVSDLGRTAWREWETDGVPSSGAHQPLKSEILAFLDGLDEAVTPGHILAVRSDGVEERWKDVMSANMVQIKSVTEGTGNTIEIECYRPHGYTSGDLVYCRVGGWDGLTHRAHRANNWDGGVLRNAAGVANAGGTYWGGDAWTVTVLDTTSFTLNDSIWKLDAGDPDPVFYHGVCYKDSLTEARAALAAAAAFITGPGGLIDIGPGFYALLAGGDIDIPHNCVIRGAGEGLTNIWVGDYFNAQAFTCLSENVHVYGFTGWGNRQFQGSARHYFRFGNEDETLPIRDVTLGPITIRGSAGYGVNVGKKAPKIRFVVDRVKIIECNNDGMDIKNGSNLNVHNKLLNSSCTTPGLGDKGSNRAQPRSLASNPIATTNASASVVVTLPFRPQYNQVINLSALATVNGVDPNGSWRVRVKSGFTATIDMGQTASGTGSGGGSVGKVVTYGKAVGKPGFDLRGPGWTVVAPQVNGELDNCIGLRMRGGTDANNNGIGSHRSTVIGPVIRDETPFEESYTKLLVIAADEVSVAGFTLEGIGGAAGTSYGLLATGTANGGSIIGGLVRSLRYGGYISGDDLQVEYRANLCGTSLYSDGDVSVAEGVIAGDGITTTSGSSVVRFVTAAAHGLSSGNTLTITDMDPFNGIDVNGVEFTGSNVVVINTTTIDIDTGIVATASGSGGGDDAEYVSTPVSRNTTGNVYSVRSKGALVEGFTITTKNTAAKLLSCSSSGDAAVITDNGTDTEFVGNSGNLYNVDRVTTLPTSGSVSIVAADSGKTLILPSNAASQVTLTMPNASALPVGFFLNVVCLNSVGVKFQMNGSNTMSDGNNNSSGGGTYASSTTGAAVCIRRRSTSGFNVASKIGTWTLA